MAKKPESRLQARIRGALEKAFPFSRWYKNHGGIYSEAGIPDLTGGVAGLAFFLEVKRPGEHPSEIQLETISDFNDAGCISCIVYSPEQAVALVRAAVAAPGSWGRGRSVKRWIRATLRSTDWEDMGGWGHSPQKATKKPARGRTKDKPRKHVG